MRVLISILLICFSGNYLFAQWDKYPTYEEYIAIMTKFAEDYPELCKTIEIGESGKGRKLLCAKVSDNVNIDEPEPEFLYTSTIHGDETFGFIAMLRLIDSLLTNYDKDDNITRLVDSIEIWINPLGNPDKTYMPQLVQNVDLNRNYPCPCESDFHRYYGVYDSLEPETKAFIDFTGKHNFVIGADIHGGAECALWPYASLKRFPADSAWFEMVAGNYRDTAQKYGPTGFFTNFNNGAANHYNHFYEVHGTRMDYLTYFRHCKSLHLELSVQKLLNESKLNAYWNYHYRSLFNYIEQVLYGIRGTVTDAFSGEPIKAKVFIENHDRDSSHTYSTELHGDYYRPIYAGTYDMTFSADNFQSKTINNVIVENGRATIVDVQLKEDTEKIKSTKSNLSGVLISNNKNMIKITYNIEHNTEMQVKIFNTSGSLVRNLNARVEKAGSCIIWTGLDNKGYTVPNGCYILSIKYSGKIITKHFIFSR